MKKLFLIIAIALSNFYTGFAQYTPNGYEVNATYSTNNQANYDNDAAYIAEMENLYGVVAKTTISDDTYNCHGYAWIGEHWSMDEGTVAWFYDDIEGGYVETIESDPDVKIVTYPHHSAIVITEPEFKYESKWGDRQVFYHNDETTYGLAPTHYYKLAKYNLYFNANGGTGSLPANKLNVIAGSYDSKITSTPTPLPTGAIGWATSPSGIPISFSVSNPYRITSTSQTLYAVYAAGTISGSTTVHYSGEGYTLNNVFPTGGTITWEVSPSNLFSVSPSTGSSTKIMKTSNTNSGQVTLIAKVNGVVVDTETLTAYSVGMSGPSSLYSGGYYSFYVPYAAGVTYSWSGGFIEVASGGDTQIATFYVPYDGSYGYAECTVTNNGVTTYLWLSAPIY